jgi:hypothetical protein
MAPRTGPRGVTIEDVANRAGVPTYVNTSSSQAPPIDAATLATYLFGGQAPGYGQRYGGFPTAAFGSAAIQGQAFQIADLARQAQALAAQRQADLVAAADRQQRIIESDTASEYRRQQRRAGQGLENILKNPLPQPEPIRSRHGYWYAAPDPNKLATFAASQEFKEGNKAAQAEREAAMKSRLAPVISQLESDLATQVDPAQGIAQALGAFTPSQLAQQIATSRYGYDPMLAAGLFGAQTDLDYAAQQQAIRDAQMSQMGYNVGMTNDEILASRLTPEEFQQYQLQKALGSYENTMGDTTAEDQDLFSVYGVLPGNDQERAIMMDDKFANVVANARATMMSQKSVDPRSAAGQIARGFLQQNPGEPARARLLDEILRQYAFLIEDPLAATNINVQL